MEELIAHLKRFRKRLRLFDGWIWVQRGIWLPISLSLVLQLVGRMVPIDRLWTWTLLLPFAWIVIGSIYHLTKPFPMPVTARRIDIELQLYERISTCLSLDKNSGAFPRALIEAQEKDALHAARGVRIRSAYPLIFKRDALIRATVLLVFVIALIFLPNPMDEILAERKSISEVAKSQAQQIQELRKEVIDSEELSAEDRQEIERLLAELADRLDSNPGNIDQALADLSRVEREIETFLNPRTSLQAANLKSLVEQLNNLESQDSNSESNLVDQANKSLEEIAENYNLLDNSQRRMLSVSLAQMAAQASQSGDSQLAQALSTLSQALISGDQRAVESSSKQSAAAISQAEQRIQSQARIGEIISSLQSSQMALAQSGQASTQGPSTLSNQGQAGGGGGTNAPVLPPGSSQGLANTPQGNKPLSGEDDLDNQDMVPRENGNTGGDELFIPGAITGQGTTEIRPGDNQSPGITNPNLVPYEQAYYTYLNTAMQSISQDYIPLGMMKYVQQYFLLLEPK